MGPRKVTVQWLQSIVCTMYSHQRAHSHISLVSCMKYTEVLFTAGQTLSKAAGVTMCPSHSRSKFPLKAPLTFTVDNTLVILKYPTMNTGVILTTYTHTLSPHPHTAIIRRRQGAAQVLFTGNR